MFTLCCPSCGSAGNLQVTAAMPLRAWLHCGSCNHLWKTSGLRLLCRWIVGAHDRTRDAAPDDEVPLEVHAPVHAAPIDSAIEEWLSESSDDRQRARDISVNDWLEANPLEAPAPGTPVFDDGYFLPPPKRAPAPAPETLGERLATFYDGLVRLEEFVKRCTQQEEAVVEAAAQAAEAAGKVASAGATTATPRRGSVLPFQRLAG